MARLTLCLFKEVWLRTLTARLTLRPFKEVGVADIDGTGSQLAEKVGDDLEKDPSVAKAGSFLRLYGPAKARPLQSTEFFRKLFS